MAEIMAIRDSEFPSSVLPRSTLLRCRTPVIKAVWKRIKSELAVWRVGALPGLVVIAAVTIGRGLGGLQLAEWAVLDRGLRWRPAEAIDERIVVIGLTEQDIQRIGRYPVPDRDLANLLQTLQRHQPTVIGLDIFRDLPVEPGHAELAAVLRSTPNVIGIEKALAPPGGTPTAAPPLLPPEQVGFADAILDDDGYLRRSLLGTSTATGDYRFSLSLRLAAAYLATKGIELENGSRDPEAMRFGQVELTRFQPTSGGYVGADAGGNQVLLNFRSGQTPFRMLSLQDIQTGNFKPEWIRDRVILIGITALSVKDVVSSAAVPGRNPGLVNGVEVQAHAVSQIISAVLDDRPLLRVWSDGWEIAWIVTWGLVGIGLGRLARSTWRSLLRLGAVSVGLVGLCYGLLLWGWWVPLLPALIVLVLNAAGPTAVLFYRHEQDLRLRLQERQFILEHTFNTIHNGPLQTLARMLREAEADQTTAWLGQLRHLNQELRSVHEAVRSETLAPSDRLSFEAEADLDLKAPLHELLYQVYEKTLQRDFPCFRTIRVKVVTFDPLHPRHLSPEQKRGLCRVLEEALCNVGKYAIGATRLTVLCTQTGRQLLIRVTDNGVGLPSDQSGAGRSSGYGTQQATRLIKQLGGSFRRWPHKPQGTICEFTWTDRRFRFW